jgi:DNA-directed RNA polymerase specialized sigma54-like protein
MTMELEHRQTLSPEFSEHQVLKASPRLIAANFILHLSSQELQQTLAKELQDNPALEPIDVLTCRVCARFLRHQPRPRGSSSSAP